MPVASLREIVPAQPPRAVSKPRLPDEQQPATPSDSVRLVVKKPGGVALLPLQDVECLEADGNTVIVHAADGEQYRIRDSLSNMFEQLHAHGFLRLHRGTVVRAMAIVGVEKGRYRKAFCVLRNAGKFEIGRVEFQRLRPLWQTGVLDLQALSVWLQLVPAAPPPVASR